MKKHAAVFTASGLSYFLGAAASYALSLPSGGVVAIWIPSGLLLGTLLLIDRRLWASAVAGAFIGNAAADLRHGTPWSVSLEGAAANSLESVAGAWLLTRFARKRVTFGTLRDVGGFIIVAVLGSNALTSVAGAIVQMHGSGSSFGRGWFVWWAGDGMGMLMLTPGILTVASLVRHRVRIRRALAIEGIVTVAAIGLAASVLLTIPSSGVTSPALLVFPLVIWAAIRGGPSGAALATLVLYAATAIEAARVPGLFGPHGSSGAEQALDLYSFLALASISSLIPAAILNERGRLQAGLVQSERRLRQMAEHIREAFFVVDVATGDALYMSPTWAEIWGRPIEQAYNRSIWFESIHPDDRPAMIEAQEQVKHGEPSTLVFRVIRPDGSIRWVRGRSFPVRDTSGAVYRMVGVSEDITDVRLAEARLSQAQKMDAIGRLAGGVAHDFNNLLTVILSYSGMLLGESSLNAEQREEIEGIRGAGESAAALTRQLLTFSRQDVLQPQYVHLNEHIESTTRMLCRLIGENVQLEVLANATQDVVFADPGQIQQVVVNLAVNARDAMPDGGKLLIETSSVVLPATRADDNCVFAAGSYAMVAVSDTGHGMDAATKARIFEAFFTTKEKGHGTGLGLATVQEIVRQSGGFISVYSEPGCGTSFKVYLPIAHAPVPTAEASAPSASTRGTETVLVVEDDLAVLAIVKSVLERFGYRVHAMTDGARAIDFVAASEEPIDLLLTDIIMKGMSGRVLADMLAELRPGINVLFMSGYTSDAVIRHGVLESKMHYLEKPFTGGKLARKVREVLDA